MVTFKRLNISRYKAIKEATYDYTTGVFRVEGRNMDTSYTSNGSAKSTLLQALSQCLFNKAPSTPTLETALYQHRPASEVGYVLTLSLSKDGEDYMIINDRRAMTLQVLHNGVNIASRGVSGGLRAVQALIGTDYDTFNALTYLSGDSISSLLDNFTKSSLVKSVLNLNDVATLEKGIKASLATAKASLSTAQRSIGTIDATVEALSTFTVQDPKPYEEKRDYLLAARKNGTPVSALVATWQARHDALMAEYHNLSAEASDLRGLLSNPTCPTCGADASVEHITDEMLADLDKAIQAAAESYSDAQVELSNLLDREADELAQLDTDLEVVRSQLVDIEANNRVFELNAGQTAKLAEDLAVLAKERDRYGAEVRLLTAAAVEVKSGRVTESVIKHFTDLLNDTLRRSHSLVTLPYVNIEVVPMKNSLRFKLYDTRWGTYVPLSSLSGGERSRVSLLVLMSLLSTVGVMTDSRFNVLFMDESLDGLDESASVELAAMFRNFVDTNDTHIAVISHGRHQLDHVDFKGVLTMVKENAVSRLVRSYNEQPT